MNQKSEYAKDDSQQQIQLLRSKYHHKRTKVMNCRDNHYHGSYESLEGINVQEEVKKIQNSLNQSVRRQKMSSQQRMNLVQKLKLRNRSLKCLSKQNDSEKNEQSLNALSSKQEIKKQKQSKISSLQNSFSTTAVYNFNKVIEEEWKRQNQMVFGLDKIDNISQRKKIERTILAKKYKMNRNKKENAVEAKSSNTLISNDQDTANQVELILKQKDKQFEKLSKIEADPYQKYLLHYCTTSFHPSPVKHSPAKQMPQTTRNSPQKTQKISKKQLQMISNAIQQRLKRRQNSNKNNFVVKINSLCKQIKKKQEKLNGYFKLFGEQFRKFIPGHRPQQSEIKKVMTWDLKGFQPKFHSRTQRSSLLIPESPKPPKPQPHPHPHQTQIPTTLLTQIQAFYSTSQCQTNKNSFKRSPLNNNHNSKQNLPATKEPLSDRLHKMKNVLMTTNKKMKICNKIKELQKQRIYQSFSNKIVPFLGQREGVCQMSKLGNIVGYF